MVPSHHLTILRLHIRTHTQIVLRVLRDGICRPGDLCLKHGRLVRPDRTSILGDELVLGNGVVNAGEGFLVWVEGFGNFGCAVGEEVSADEREVGEKFVDFGIGEDKGKDGAKVSNGWIYDEMIKVYQD